MSYFAENTTTHLTTQLPHQIRLQGSWSVALTEVQIPLTFQHISIEPPDRIVSLNLIPHSTLETKVKNFSTAGYCRVLLRPEIYKDVSIIVSELNNLSCIEDHLEFGVEPGGYVTVNRVCTKTTCSEISHQLHLSKKLRRILGFENTDSIFIRDEESVVSDRPAHLSNGLASMVMIYSDICEPYVTGDVQSRLLRAVSLNIDDYTYGSTRIKSFSPPMYIPLLYNSFQTIEIDIRDQSGCAIPFDYGTLTVTLHFKKLD